MAYKAGFKKCSRVRFVCWGFELSGQMSSNKNAGQRVREEWSRSSFASTLRVVI
jgi:hypothetical protein